MSETSTLIGYKGRTIPREELALVPTPAATKPTYQSHEIVQALVEALGFRHIGVVHDEYVVSPDGMKVFGSSISKPRCTERVSRSGSETVTTRACASP
jgi:hypothetical protein